MTNVKNLDKTLVMKALAAFVKQRPGLQVEDYKDVKAYRGDAHALGSYLHGSGRCVPTDVRMGRGDSIRSGDMRFSFKHTGKHVIFTRES